MSDEVVTLSTDRPDIVSVPSDVTIPDGATSIDFQARTAPVPTQQVATVTATGSDGSSVEATLTLDPTPVIRSLSFSPSSLVGGESSTGTVERS